jgi:hypothetical protein
MTREVAGERNTIAILVADTVTRLAARHAGTVLVIGSQGGAARGRSGQRPAGRRRRRVRSIPAGTVDGLRARIRDARSLWATGRLSCVNRALWMCGVNAGLSVQEAIQSLY